MSFLFKWAAQGASIPRNQCTSQFGFDQFQEIVFAQCYLIPFGVDAPDRIWVTDITYIRTLEGFAYLAVVIDLYARRVVGWSLQSRQTTDLVLQAADGRVAQEGEEQGADPFGSGLPVHQQGLGVFPKGSQSGTLDELAQELPRQRGGQELLQPAQARTNTAPDL